MLMVVPVMFLGSLFFLFGSRHLPGDQDRAQAVRPGDQEIGELIAEH